MMQLNEAELQLLEDFWNERLSPEKRADLKRRLDQDADFRAAANEWKQLLAEGFGPPAAEAQELKEIKKRLATYQGSGNKDAEPKTKHQTGPKNRLRPIYIGLAAAAAILLLFLFTPLGDILQPADPYADYFAHLPRDNANLSDNTEDGRLAYDRKDYEVAYPALMAEVAAGADSLNLLYAAVAAIGSGQSEAAVSILEPLVATERWAFYQEEIRWYLALGYLETDQLEKAIDQLEVLGTSSGPYQETAQELTEQIKTN